MDPLWTLVVLLTVALGASWLVIVGFVYRLRRAEGSVVALQDSAARDDRIGEPVVLPRPPEGEAWLDDETVLVFVSSGCLHCRLLADVARSLDLTRTKVRFIVSDAAGLDHFEALDEAGWWVFPEAFSAAGINVTPFALTVDPTGRVTASGVVPDERELARLLGSTSHVPDLTGPT